MEGRARIVTETKATLYSGYASVREECAEQKNEMTE